MKQEQQANTRDPNADKKEMNAREGRLDQHISYLRLRLEEQFLEWQNDKRRVKAKNKREG